jgi:hypothetical protein
VAGALTTDVIEVLQLLPAGVQVTSDELGRLINAAGPLPALAQERSLPCSVMDATL